MGGGSSDTRPRDLRAGHRPERYNFPSKPKANLDAIVTGGKDSNYRFTILTSRLLRYEWSDDGTFEDRASIFAPFRFFEKPDFRVVENDRDGTLEIITDSFHLVYDRKEFSSAGLAVTVNAPNISAETWRYDGKNYGDLGGTARTLDNADGRIPIEPGILSARKPFAVLDDSESMLFGEDGWVASRVKGRKDGYVFCYGRDHKDAIKDFYRLSGRQPVLPRWALGNWWSRYHEYDANEYLALMDHFKKEGIPMTVGVLDMDWHRVKDVPKKYGSGWTGYSWNKQLFPDPEGFLKELHKRGLKIALNDHPADGVRAYEDQYKDVAKYLDFDVSHDDPIRFDCTDKRFIDAYLDVLWAGLEKQGVDFTWIDWQQGTQSKVPNIDPLWVLNHYHYLTSSRNVSNLSEPITFSRYAGPGSHRYPIGFSGDTLVTWDSLHFQPEFTATANNIGYGWWSHDIGGHYWGTRSNDLTARWVQLGCFSPILRLHSTKDRWMSKEPWLFESHDVIRRYMILRHRLIPFLYTMSVRAAFAGEPLIQPMYWNHSHDEEAYKYPNEYYFGPDLIVAPITTPQSSATLMGAVKAWLPKGRYVDLMHSQMVYDGGREVRFHRTLDKIPVLAKEGSILPLDYSPIAGNGAPLPTNFEVVVVVGKDASFELLEEDENKRGKLIADRTKEDFVSTPIRWDQSAGKLTIGPASKPSDHKRSWTVRLAGHTDAKSTARHTTRKTEDGHTQIELGTHSVNNTVTLQLAPDPQLDVVDLKERVYEVIYRAETAYKDKEAVWQLVTQDKAPLHVRLAKLYEMKIDEDLRSAVLEIWLADARALEASAEKEQAETERPLSAGFEIV